MNLCTISSYFAHCKMLRAAIFRGYRKPITLHVEGHRAISRELCKPLRSGSRPDRAAILLSAQRPGVLGNIPAVAGKQTEESYSSDSSVGGLAVDNRTVKVQMRLRCCRTALILVPVKIRARAVRVLRWGGQRKERHLTDFGAWPQLDR